MTARLEYMSEQWYELLASAAQRHRRQAVAVMLDVSPAVITQVLNGTGKYGTGAARTDRIASRVVHTFGRYPCPHLSAEDGAERIVTGDDCRVYAHRPAPIGSPRQMQHWQACQTCPHKAATAPAAPKESS